MKEKVTIFGGAGFLGSHVADELSNQGYDVLIADINPSPYAREDQRIELGSILDKAYVAKVCEDADYIYNFAGLADINEAKDKPEETFELNVMGHINILKTAQKLGVKRLIFASTVYVFSETGSFYRASKQASEKVTELFGERYALPFTIVRYGSLYGPRSDNRNTIYNFIRSALEEKKLRYNGTGNELREYIHVFDAAVASVQVLAPEFQNQHVVITGHHSYRVRDVMFMIKEILQNEPAVEFAGSALDAHYNNTPYSFKPRPGKKLVVNPFVDMGQGLLGCIDDLAHQLGLSEI